MVRLLGNHMTLFRFITMFYGTDNITQNNPHIQIEYGSVPQNIVMDLNNVMYISKVVII